MDLDLVDDPRIKIVINLSLKYKSLNAYKGGEELKVSILLPLYLSL